MKLFYNQDDINEVLENLKKEIKLIKNKKILLLGYNGFLGKYFVKIFDQIISDYNLDLKVDCYDNFISSCFNSASPSSSIFDSSSVS